jgi:hypothetical protein
MQAFFFYHMKVFFMERLLHLFCCWRFSRTTWDSLIRIFVQINVTVECYVSQFCDCTRILELPNNKMLFLWECKYWGTGLDCIKPSYHASDLKTWIMQHVNINSEGPDKLQFNVNTLPVMLHSRVCCPKQLSSEIIVTLEECTQKMLPLPTVLLHNHTFYSCWALFIL